MNNLIPKPGQWEGLLKVVAKMPMAKLSLICTTAVILMALGVASGILGALPEVLKVLLG